jgi:hypothetical protein
VTVQFDAAAPPMLAEQMNGLRGDLEIRRLAWQVHGGLGLEHLFVLEQNYSPVRTGGWGILVGARVGYRLPFADGAWGNEDYDFSGGPRLGASGSFISSLPGRKPRPSGRGGSPVALFLDITFDGFERCSATRHRAVAGRPEVLSPQFLAYLG